MQHGTSNKHPESSNRIEWVLKVRDELLGTHQKTPLSLRTTVSCRINNGRKSLYIPQEMSRDQPEVLEYLHAFAASQNLVLTEDRRLVDLPPIVEQRKRHLPKMALGITLLLKQTGLPGPTRSLSTPHVLGKDNRKLDICKIIRTAAGVFDKSRKIVFLPNRFILQTLGEETDIMNGYACKVVSREEKTTFVQFECDNFHAIGYITNNQFVISVFLGGGPISRPELWTSYDSLMESPFRCQIISSPFPAQQYGLFYKTFYIDLQTQTELDQQTHSQSA